MTLDPKLQTLLAQPNFAALTTLNREGMPSTHVMWVGDDGEHLLINTEVHRQKYKNVQNDPRVAITVIDHENAYRYAEVRGRVVEEVRGQEARDHIDQLSRKYEGKDYGTQIQSERVILKVQPEKLHLNNV